MTHKGHYAIAASILLTAIVLAFTHSGEAADAGRFQLVSHGESVFVIDTATGRTWQKYHLSNQGPTAWAEVESPWKSAGH